MESIPRLYVRLGCSIARRLYGTRRRNAIRTPSKVLTEEDQLNKQKKYVAPSSEYEPFKDPKEEESITAETDMEPKSPTKPNFPKFEKMGKEDLALSRFVMDSSCKKKRVESNLIMLEGKRLITEALQAKLTLKALFFSRLSDVESLPLPSDKFIFQKIVYKRIQRYSSVVTSSGIIGFFKTPSLTNASDQTLPLTLICDNIRDPGNLGSILRVAASVGCQKVILSKGCVDLWDSKVLRAGAGAHFHVPVIHDVSWDDMHQHLNETSQVFLADNTACVKDYEEVIQDDIYAPAPSETLVDHTKMLPFVPYYSANYSLLKHIVLFIGGETEGLSNDAFELAHSHNGIRLNIPMANCVESLNAGTALGIITYEMLRQVAIWNSRKKEARGAAPLINV